MILCGHRTSFQPPKPQPVPSTIVSVTSSLLVNSYLLTTQTHTYTQGDSMPVKLNTAAILREGARIQKAEEEEIKKYKHIHTVNNSPVYMQITRLANLEAGGRDDSEFIRWQEGMKQVTMTP